MVMFSSPSLPLRATPKSPRPFLSLPDVIRERIYFFVLTIDVDPRAPWITPLPSSRLIPKHLPGLPTEPDCNLDHVSKSVRKKRRRRMRAFESIKQEAIIAAQAAAPPACLAILATCRTILLEAFHLWYKHNTLNFSRSKDLYDFLGSIGRVRASEIRNIRLDIPGEEWEDPKAVFVLGQLLRLERLIFIYNSYGPKDTKPQNIGYPRIISHLRGLQQVSFLDPESPRTTLWGQKEGMSRCVQERMDELREKMLARRKKPRLEPPMMDLFNRLRMMDQEKKNASGRKWEEALSYAPEIHRAS
ncbi:MAG: hypothetical protein Q9170_003241 [Blastenia crenularia]